MARKKKNLPNKTYEVVTKQNVNGDVILPLPPELIKKLKWADGDNLEFCVGKDGNFILRKTS
jgi:hypothetical protein